MSKMPTDFPSWYATLEAGEGGKATARRAGVAKLLENPKFDEAEALIRLALKTKVPPDQAVAARTVEKIQTGDPTFGSADAARELQVLAAGALVGRLLGSQVVALALTTAGLDGGRKANLPMDLIGLAEDAVRQLAKSTRARQAIKEIEAPAIEVEISEDEAAQKTVFQILEAFEAANSAAVGDVVKGANQSIKELVCQQELVEEELQMLWWLTAGETRAGEAIAALSATVKPFTVADELATRTVRRPGPLSVPALLSRVGLSRKGKIKVVDAVNAMSADWSPDAAGTLAISAVTHPIHEAIRRRNETGAGPDWVAAWAAVTGVDADHGLSPLRLAELFYRERLLLTVMA